MSGRIGLREERQAGRLLARCIAGLFPAACPIRCAARQPLQPVGPTSA